MRYAIVFFLTLFTRRIKKEKNNSLWSMYVTFRPLLLSLIVFNLRYSILIYVSSVSLISFPFLENYDLKSYEREMLLLKKRYMKDDLFSSTWLFNICSLFPT